MSKESEILDLIKEMLDLRERAEKIAKEGQEIAFKMFESNPKLKQIKSELNLLEEEIGKRIEKVRILQSNL